MIYDILEKFKKSDAKDFFLDKYTLKDGLYVKITKDEKLEFFLAKTKKMERIFKNLQTQNEDYKSYEWFKRADYLSNYLNSNKALYDKKIHNCNYLSLFFKIENSDYVKEKISDHFFILGDFAKFDKKEEKNIIKEYKSYLFAEERIDDMSKKEEILSKSFDKIVQKAKDEEVSNYIKIFFDEDFSLYESESKVYLALKIFNNNEFNQQINNLLHGLSNSNMGLNSKKPYLENKTKKTTTPFLVNLEDAFLLKVFFDWLKFQPYRDDDKKPIDRYLSEEFFIQKITSNDEAVITEYDYIPVEVANINKSFKPILVKNITFAQIYNEKEKKYILEEDIEIKNIEMLEQKINQLFFNNQLIQNYYKDAKDIKVSSFLSKNLHTILLQSRNSMLNYLRKFDETYFTQSVKKYFSLLIIENLLNGRENTAKNALNLQIAILKKYKENVMDIEQLQSQMKNKLESSDYKSLSESEFLYLCGQCALYMLSQSKATKQNADMLEPFLRSRNPLKLKNSIMATYEKYAHALRLKSLKFNNAIALILAFEEQEKITNFDPFLIGVLTQNLFYEKTQQGEKE